MGDFQLIGLRRKSGGIPCFWGYFDYDTYFRIKWIYEEDVLAIRLLNCVLC